MATWNERIHERRIAQGITLAQVASKLGVTEATAQRYESGNIKSIPYEHMCAYGKILNCSPAYLMGWEKETDATISKELQISKEALYVINKFSLTIDKNTGHSMMDIFNAVIIHENFKDIIKDMLLFFSRTKNEWEDMVKYFSRNVDTVLKSIESVQSLCYLSITKQFEQLVIDVLNSDIKTFNDVKKDETGNLVIGIRPENEISIYKNNKKLSDMEMSEEIQPSSRQYFTNAKDARNYLESLEDKPAAFGGLSTDENIIAIANDIKKLEIDKKI